MRVRLFAILLLAAPALADAPPAIAVAPAGVCAGEEPELVVRLLPRAKSTADAAAQAANGALHLSPSDVAAPSSHSALAAPALPSFAGPGACDNPGSGCIPEKIIDDPNPGTGCGFPGSPCP